jgi:hypothetical protein
MKPPWIRFLFSEGCVEGEGLAEVQHENGTPFWRGKCRPRQSRVPSSFKSGRREDFPARAKNNEMHQSIVYRPIGTGLPLILA